MFLHALEERHFLLCQHLRLLFAHSAPQDICAPQGIACKDTRSRLDLLLIYDQAACFVKHRRKRLLQFRVDRLDLLQAVLALCIIIM